MFDDYFYDAIWVADDPIDLGPPPVELVDEPDPQPWDAGQDPVPWREAQPLAETARANLAAAIEAEDRLGNHEIQQLMQIMNRNETLESNVLEKTMDIASAIIGKI